MTTNRSWLMVPVMAAIVALTLVFISCDGGSPASGTLTGQITIGPLQPVERPGSSPPVPPEVFTSRRVVVYDEAGKNPLKEINIEQIDQSATGQYSVMLKAGKYTVDINHSGIDHSSDVPRVVVIEPEQTVVLNINIDTGIR